MQFSHPILVLFLSGHFVELGAIGHAILVFGVKSALGTKQIFIHLPTPNERLRQLLLVEIAVHSLFQKLGSRDFSLDAAGHFLILEI